MENKVPLLDNVTQPKCGSDALLKYIWAKNCDLKLFHLIVDTVLASDYAVHIAKRALAGTKDDQTSTANELASKNPGIRTQALRNSSQELLEMLTTRIIDNFQIYLVSIIKDVLNVKPEILSSRKQELTVSHILKFTTIEDLIKDIIEVRINSLSYEGFGEIQEWCIEKGIPITVPQGFKPDIIALISLRNIIVHNRGCVDFRYLKATNNSELKVGEKFRLDVDHLFNSLKLLDAVIFKTDEEIVEKFKLEAKEIEPELHLLEKR